MVHALERTVSSSRLSFYFGLLILVSGAGGMAISFVFLASRHDADLIAGAAGFVAGSILVAAGQLSVTLLDRPVGLNLRVREKTIERPPLAVEHWIHHFRRNKGNRIEPEWTTPMMLSPDVVQSTVVTRPGLQPPSAAAASAVKINPTVPRKIRSEPPVAESAAKTRPLPKMAIS